MSPNLSFETKICTNSAPIFNQKLYELNGHAAENLKKIKMQKRSDFLFTFL
jgi:hypothetical protein